MYEVVIVLLMSVIAGLVGGLLLATLGTSPVPAVGAGATAFAGVFGIGMTAVAYIKKQDS